MAYTFHPSAKIGFILAGILAVVCIVTFTVFREPLGDFYIPILVLSLVVCAMHASAAYFTSQAYTITLEENDIVYTKGLFAIHRTTLPYSKITESHYSQSALERILGLGTLNIDTPGGSDMAIHARNVRYEDIKKTLDAVGGKGDAPAEPPAHKSQPVQSKGEPKDQPKEQPKWTDKMPTS